MDRRRAYTKFGNTSYATQSSYTPSKTTYSGMAGSNQMRGTDIIAEYLVKEKVPYILGYAGHGAIGLLDGIQKQTDRIRHISPRIEQGAGFMADVYFRLTGNPLAVYASTGPGADEPDDLGRQRLLRQFRLLRDHRQRADHPAQLRRAAGRLPLQRRHVLDLPAGGQEVLPHQQGGGPVHRPSGRLPAHAHRPTWPGPFRHPLRPLYRGRTGLDARSSDRRADERLGASGFRTTRSNARWSSCADRNGR